MPLTREKFMKTCTWMKRNARPLEAARWEYLFEAGSKENVLHYLSAFQNDDGGFGHGLEPDFWVPLSSPMATWAAAQILMEVNADAQDIIVQRLIAYLTNSEQKEEGMWASVIPETNDYPHAFWWEWKDNIQSFWNFNPSAELAAYLVQWSAPNSESAAVGWQSLEKAIHRLMECTDMDKHELNNYQQLVNVMTRLQSQFEERVNVTLEKVIKKIEQLIDICIEKDPSQWAGGYQPLPLDFIKSPHDHLYTKYKLLVDKNIEFFINELSDEGTWDITWDWEGYPKQFAVARRQWQGILAVERYKILKAFNKVE